MRYEFSYVLLLLLLLASCTVVPATNIKIGVLLPLTGDFSTIGNSNRAAINLAQNNSDEQLFFEDDSCDAKKAITAFQKLVQVDHVDAIVGPLCTSVLPALLPNVKQAGIPLVLPITDHLYFVNDLNTTEYDNLTLGLLPRSDLVWQEHARIAFSISKSIAIVQTTGVATRRNVNLFLKMYEELGGRTIVHEEVEPRTKDYRTLLLKLDSLGAPLVWPHLGTEDRIEFYKQLRELGVLQNATILGDLYIEVELPKYLAILGQTLNGTLSTNYASTMTASFRERMVAQGVQPLLGADNSYDAIRLLINAEKKCQNQKACIIPLLKQTSEDGASGKIQFDNDGNRIGTAITRALVGNSFVKMES